MTSSVGAASEDPRDPAAVANVDRDTDSESSPLLSKQERTRVGSIVLILFLGVFVANADGSLVLATYGLISSDFRDLAGSGWILTSYMVAGCATQALYGKLSDIFGRKGMLLVAYSLFTVGLAICTSLWHFILGRVISGCGGAGMTVLVSIIIADLVPIKEIAVWRSYVNIAATVGRSLGGPLGGVMADAFGWRWSFFGQCPLAVIAIISVSFMFKDLQSSSGTMREKIGRVDFLGVVSMTSTITLLLMLLNAFENGSGLRIGLYAAATVLSGAAFVMFERRAAEPIFPPKFFAQRPVITAYLLGMCQMAAQLGMMFSVPIYFQLTQNISTSLAGVHLFPAVAGNALGGVVSGIFIKRSGRYKSISVFAAIVSSISYTLLLVRWHGRTNFWEALYIVPGGFGTGIALSTTFIGLSAGVRQSEIAIAGAGLYMTNNMGGILGLTTVTVVLKWVLSSKLVDNLREVPDSDKIIRASLESLDYIQRLPEPTHTKVLAAYIYALGATHVVNLIFSVLGFIVALCMQQVDIS